MSTALQERGARVVPVPPPLMYALPFATGLLLHRVVPATIGGRPVTAGAGAIVLAAGLALTWSGVFAVVRHRTTIVPHRPVALLLTGGPYSLTRNPMYTGLATAYVGGTLLAGTWLPLVFLPVVLLVVRRVVIDPEERYLVERFDPDYTAYQRRVRRWI